MLSWLDASFVGPARGNSSARAAWPRSRGAEYDSHLHCRCCRRSTRCRRRSMLVHPANRVLPAAPRGSGTNASPNTGCRESLSAGCPHAGQGDDRCSHAGTKLDTGSRNANKHDVRECGPGAGQPSRQGPPPEDGQRSAVDPPHRPFRTRRGRNLATCDAGIGWYYLWPGAWVRSGAGPLCAPRRAGDGHPCPRCNSCSSPSAVRSLRGGPRARCPRRSRAQARGVAWSA